MNATPQTDAQFLYLADELIAGRMTGDKAFLVFRDFARKLEAALAQCERQRAEAERQFQAKVREIGLLLEEIEVLRSWGNKDCTAMADAELERRRGRSAALVDDLRCLRIRIEKATDPQAWYTERIGEVFVVERFEVNRRRDQGIPEDVYWVRTGRVYNTLNYVRKSDATAV